MALRLRTEQSPTDVSEHHERMKRPRRRGAGVVSVLLGFAACGCSTITHRQTDRSIDITARSVANRMSLEKDYLDEHLAPDTSARGALARDAQGGGGEVLRADGDVRERSGAVIVARFSTTETDVPGGGARTVARCRKFTVTTWFEVRVDSVTCPQGAPMSIPTDHRGWRKCPGVAIWRPVDAPEPCNPGG
jgi:hypothetical protein